MYTVPSFPSSLSSCHHSSLHCTALHSPRVSPRTYGNLRSSYARNVSLHNMHCGKMKTNYYFPSSHRFMHGLPWLGVGGRKLCSENLGLTFSRDFEIFEVYMQSIHIFLFPFYDRGGKFARHRLLPYTFL